MKGLLGLIIVFLCFPAFAESTEMPAPSFGKSHAFAMFGTPKYPAGFTHFDYVNPKAPKGGRINLGYFLPFDSLNAFALKGSKAPGLFGTDHTFNGRVRDLMYDALMVPSLDEPETLYGLIAESIEVAKDYSWVEFTLRPQARWHDHTPITAEDVVFTFKILPEKGDPNYKITLAPVTSVTKTGPRSVRFEFSIKNNRQLPDIVAQIPILPRSYYDGEKHKLDASTLEPPLGSGPYKISQVDQGRSIAYERVKDYWANDLPVRVGQNNFDVIHFQAYRDSTVALEGIKSGQYDLREENISRNWATAYDTPAVKDGRLLKLLIPHKIPTGNQAYVINTKRYPDIRVREALGLAFDFEWTNSHIFFNAYERNTSFFENTDFAAKTLPSKEELKLLEPFRDQLPKRVFTKVFSPPTTNGKTTLRDNLLRAQQLLNDADYVLNKDGWRVNKKTGELLTVQILHYDQSFNRAFLPYIANLKRLGIKGSTKIVEIAQFQRLLDTKNFSMMVGWVPGPGLFFPGTEQRNYWHCSTSELTGSINYGGVCNKAVDMLVEKIDQASTLEELQTYAHALDRILQWEFYTIPQYHLSAFRVVHWNKFNKPAIAPNYDVGVSTWWPKEGKK